ncbi:Hypothetical predicted protein, partial [Marmota monax]
STISAYTEFPESSRKYNTGILGRAAPLRSPPLEEVVNIDRDVRSSMGFSPHTLSTVRSPHVETKGFPSILLEIREPTAMGAWHGLGRPETQGLGMKDRTAQGWKGEDAQA